jgi:hypothetical protein
LALNAQTPKRELTLANPVQQFDARDRDGRSIKILKTEHRPDARFHATMILLDRFVQERLGRSHIPFRAPTEIDGILLTINRTI